MNFRRPIAWERYPENDVSPQHYSCPFGIVLLGEDKRWYAWTTTAAYREVASEEELNLCSCVGSSSRASVAKRFVESVVGKMRTCPPAMSANA